MERRRQSSVVAAICAALISICPAAHGKVIYVDDDAPGPGDGSSWQTAYKFLQEALVDAGLSAEPVEVRVAQGIYRPDRSSVHPDGTRDQSASFTLLDDVAIMGGFAGVGAPDPNVRDIALYETILSGDLAGDDVPVASPRDLLTEPTRAENTDNIVTAEPCGRSAILEGFTIRSALGGALYLPENVRPCRPSIRNCAFVGNRGPAVCVFAGIEPELTDCLFLENASWVGGAAIGDTLGRGLHPEADKFVVRRCTFVRNLAAGTAKDIRGAGGAINIMSGPPSIIEDCTFVGNTAEIGGAIYSKRKENIVNCRFIQNVADQSGGAVYLEGTELNMAFCTLFGNVAPAGRALTCFAPRMTVTNSILWDDSDEHSGVIQIGEITGPNVTYCDVQGGWPGEGNIDTDPLFAIPGYWDPNGTPEDPNDDFLIEGDYHLKSQAGRWDPKSESWVIDDVTSPCIDTGDPNSPVGDEPEPNGGRINMGAYGGTAEASMSPEAGPTAGLWSEPLPLSEVNLDTAEEWSPSLSADGLTLYFGRVARPESYYGRIFQATRQLAVPWSRFAPVIELPGTLNESVEHVLTPWISADGLRMYYTHQVGSVFRLMVSERPAGSTLWPMGREIRELNELDSRLHTARLTVDELTIFFAGPDQQSAEAEYDIWMATRPDRDALFDEPVNMTSLNSPANDLHATPSADGLSLYFASKRSGRYQLFRSTRESYDDSFSRPVHMVLFDTANGHSLFPCLSPDGTEFYFVRQASDDRSTRDIWVSYRLD